MADYHTVSELSAELAGVSVRFATKAGLPEGEGITPGDQLLAEHVDVPPTARIACYGCSHGALMASLATRLRGGRIVALDPSWLAVQLARRTLRMNGATNVDVLEQISLLPGQEFRIQDSGFRSSRSGEIVGQGQTMTQFDRILLRVPQSRALVRRWLVEAKQLLAPAGRLYLVGPRDSGAQAAIDDAAALFDQAAVIGYRKGWRVAEVLAEPEVRIQDSRFRSADALPDWVNEPGVAPGSWIDLELDTPSGSLQLVSLPGVFAADKLDSGTALLLEKLPQLADAQVLDIGCGYGILGIAALQAGAAHADLVDVNFYAVAAATENVRRLGLSAEVLLSDGLQAVAGRRYDVILTNPPFHAGKAVDERMAYAFIAESRAALKPGGRLMLVANRFLPYQRVMAAHFSQVEHVAATNAYHVLAAQ
jgi:16S rRNA (guanine1207-N2)-methyltransferase